MKKQLIAFLLIFMFSIIFSAKINISANEINQPIVEITSTSTLSNNIECATSSDNSYCVLKGNIIRINYAVYNSEIDADIFFGDMYGNIIDHQSAIVDNSYKGYYDIQLIYATNIIILLGINNSTTNSLIAFDSLNLEIYDDVKSLELLTVNPVGFINKTLIFDVKVNNEELLYVPDLYIYYFDKNGDKIELINNFAKDNYFSVTIDSNLVEYESVDFYLTNDKLTSLPLTISMVEVTYLEYVDIIDENVTYCILDDVVDFYARIPINSNPDFILIDNTNTVRLQSYNIIHNNETYDTVCFKVKLLEKGSTDCLLGFLSYSNNLNYTYTYKNVSFTIIENVNSLVFDKYTEDIEYGDTIMFSPLINENKDILCNVNWYLDDELIYTGPSLNYVFYNSGGHTLRIEYNGLSAEINLYVAYSSNAALVWYIAFFVILIIGIIVLFQFLKIKKTPLTNIENKAVEIQNDLKKLLETNDKKNVYYIIKKISIFENNIEIINDSYDYLSIDSTINTLKILLNNLNKLKTNKDDLPSQYRKSIENTILDLKSSFSKKNMELLRKSQKEE